MFLRQGSGPLHSPWHDALTSGSEGKGKGAKDDFVNKDEVSIQGQVAWMPPGGLLGKCRIPKPLHKWSRVMPLGSGRALSAPPQNCN